MNEINLLPKKNGTSLRQEQTVAVFRRVSIIILAATAFLSVMIFILVLQSPLSQTQDEEKRLITQLTSSSNKIARNVIIQERLSSIVTILKTRNSYEKNINVILGGLPQELKISKMDVETKKIEISGTTVSITAANTFFANLIALQNKKDTIKSVTLKSFALQGNNGTYSYTVDIVLL
jgi:Tfp pilus assembly protein PilN